MKKEKIENIDETLKKEEVQEDIQIDNLSITGKVNTEDLPENFNTNNQIWLTENTVLSKQTKKETKKYKVILATLTKFILDVDGNGQLYPMTEKYKNLTTEDEIELPLPESE